MKTGLWNRNFTLAFIGMIISAAGGVGLSIALSVVVFAETQSTTLSAVLAALSMIPQFVLPLVIGPVIDRNNPLKVLVKNEVILAALFFIAAALTYFFGFNYLLYMVFSVLISSFGVVSQLASSSVIPQIMARENYVRGNAILNVIYPLCSVAIAPLAMKLFDLYGMPLILAAYGVTSLIDAALESRIDAKFEYIEAEKTSLKEYGEDLRDGFRYFAKDPAIRSVFLLFALVMFADCSSSVLTYPFFNTSATLTNDQYALMTSIRSAGYMLGGFLHYFIKIPEKKRFSIAIGVYFVFVLLDGAFFFMPFALMCISRFLLGILGMNSANIRVSAVQSHVPNQMRAKTNALFSVLTSAAMMLGQLLAGALGELAPYWLIQIAFQGVYLLGILIFALPKRNKVKELYNYAASTEAAESA
ncbi:MAG TPA: MFS transporter [Clostridia bacterium]|nr:MFS transporter [Clostridia bacterium]